MNRWTAVWVLATFILMSAATAAEVKLEVATDGKVTLTKDGQPVWRMSAALYTPDWKGGKPPQAQEGYPKKTDSKTELRFSIAPQGQEGVVNVTMTVSVEKDTAEFHYVFEVPQPLKLNALSVSTRMPIEAVSGKTLKLGGADVKLPAEHAAGVKGLFRGNVEHATYPIPDLEVQLTTDPDTFCRVQDLREWGGKEYEMRLELLGEPQNQEIPAGAKYEKKITVRIPGLTESVIGKVGP